jgi:hypothetical protein
MITRGLIGVRVGESGHPLIEAPTLTDIAGDRHRVPGARVCAGEDVRALLGERPQVGRDACAVRNDLHVAELADVKVTTNKPWDPHF